MITIAVICMQGDACDASLQENVFPFKNFVSLAMHPPQPRLFHISEQPGISIFNPRPSPSHFDHITGDVVFAISDQLLHNYLLPRDCPRVTFYTAENTTDSDKNQFMSDTTADYVIAVENGWYQQIKTTTLFCYEFAQDDFMLIDECAGYYVSYKPALPISVTVIDDIMGALLTRNIELRFMPSLIDIAEAVRDSSLQFSLIRMRNAKG